MLLASGTTNSILRFEKSIPLSAAPTAFDEPNTLAFEWIANRSKVVALPLASVVVKVLSNPDPSLKVPVNSRSVAVVRLTVIVPV